MEKLDITSMFDLGGRVIVITGAAGLLGKKHAECVASFGGVPVLLDIVSEPLEDLKNNLNEMYDIASSCYIVDITNERAVKACGDDIINSYGRLDGLINNAANNPKVEEGKGANFSRLENFPLESWMDDISVGLTGAFICSKYFGPIIANQKNGGVILNISSDLGIIAPDQRLYKKDGLNRNEQSVKPVTYSVVKTGLIGLTKYLATYWVDEGVRCNALCPGGVENGQNSDFLNNVSSRIPMGRLAKSDEYQGAIIFMLADASSYMNGEVLVIDGGRVIW